MAKVSARYRPRDSSRRRLWVYLAVALFVVTDAVLIMAALTSPEADAPGQAAAVPSPVASISREMSTPSPAPSEHAVDVLPTAPTRLLAAVSDTTAWRATTGPCPKAPATPELTRDAGITWSPSDATAPTGVVALQTVRATSESVVEFVGLDEADCAPLLVKTFVAGDNYRSYPEQLDAAWYIDPANPAELHSPSGVVAAPCDVAIAVSVTGSGSAAVLCGTGEVFASTTGDTDWSMASALAPVASISATDGGFLAAAVGRAECRGVQVSALTSALVSSVLGCYLTEGDPAELAGTIALSSAADTLWLWSGDDLVRSSDGGLTWQ